MAVISVMILPLSRRSAGTSPRASTFLRVDAYHQEIVKGVIIVAAAVADVYRQKARCKQGLNSLCWNSVGPEHSRCGPFG
ncbi:MAG TPA: hypothetical protein VGC14_00695 [Rhizobium sp.]